MPTWATQMTEELDYVNIFNRTLIYYLFKQKHTRVTKATNTIQTMNWVRSNQGTNIQDFYMKLNHDAVVLKIE